MKKDFSTKLAISKKIIFTLGLFFLPTICLAHPGHAGHIGHTHISAMSATLAIIQYVSGLALTIILMCIVPILVTRYSKKLSRKNFPD